MFFLSCCRVQLFTTVFCCVCRASDSARNVAHQQFPFLNRVRTSAISFFHSPTTDAYNDDICQFHICLMMDLTLRVALCVLLFLQKSDSFLTTKLCHPIQHSRTKSSFISIGRLEDSSWNPAQAAEFVTWHIEGPEKAGTQLAPMIKDWIGNDVGEFLTRLVVLCLMC